MNTKLIYIGVVAFVVGFVLVININDILPGSYDYYHPISGTQLVVLMLFEFLIVMGIFGGITAMLVGSEVRASSGFTIAAILIILAFFFLIFSVGIF